MNAYKCPICRCMFIYSGIGTPVPAVPWCGLCKDIYSNFEPEESDNANASDIQSVLGTDWRTSLALAVALGWGGTDGAHHKAWTLDQVVRILSGKHYDKAVKWAKDGEEGPETYSYDEGIAP